MERYLSVTALLLLLVIAGVPRGARAVSYPLIEEQREEKAAKGVREKGEMVCLFESGTADVKKAIIVGDLLTVYRENGKHEMRAVGKIKVLSYVGEDYLKGEVIEGEARIGDVAKKGDVASLVISSEDKCK